MTLQEIIENSPILIPKDKYNRLYEQKDKHTTGSKVKIRSIHLYFPTVTRIEIRLLTEDAKSCCYLKNGLDNEWIFDGYYIYAGDTDNLPDWWKSLENQISESGRTDDIIEDVEFPEEIFKEEYFERYTREIKKLDLLVVVNYRRLAKVTRRVGIPLVNTLDHIAIESLGFTEKDNLEEDFKESIKKEVKEFYDDPLTIIPNFSSSCELSLQDIVFNGCPNHDRVQDHKFTFGYNGQCGDKFRIVATVERINDSDQICLVRFTSYDIEDKNCYLYWNASWYKSDAFNSIVHIYDDTSYHTEKIAPDFI